MSDTSITIVGNVGWTPTRKVLASGAVVTDFRVATTPRRFDKAADQWKDLETMWFGVTCWRTLADNVATSVQKGDRVVVTGRLSTRSYTTKDGESRSGFEIDATAVGFDLSRCPVTAHRPQRGPVDPADDSWSTSEVDPLTGELTGAVPEQTAA